MSHLDLADLAAYFAGDHDDEARVEEHLFSCEACTREGERVAAITETIRADVPAVLDAARLAVLERRGLRIRENALSPGDRCVVEFPRDVDVLLHRLGGLELASATQVDVAVRVESTGRTLLEVPDAPFDRDAGAVLVSCQRHFAVLPPDTQMEVRVRSKAGERVETYSIMHVFLP